MTDINPVVAQFAVANESVTAGFFSLYKPCFAVQIAVISSAGQHIHEREGREERDGKDGGGR